MRNKLFLLLVFLIFTNEIVLGKNDNDIKNIKKRKNNYKTSGILGKNERDKRSIRQVDSPLLTELGHELGNENRNDFAKYLGEKSEKDIGEHFVDKESPFWGTRGRRDSSSESMEYAGSNDVGYKDNVCKTCAKYFQVKDVDNQISPFSSSRGRKNSNEVSEFDSFWDNKVGNQEDSPFWGSRGVRQQEDPPFWGNRGRRQEIKKKGNSPFYASQGINAEDNTAFWGNRGKKSLKSHDTVEEPPFWSSRGRRDDVEPFWGNRGRRDDIETFWGNRGRRDGAEPFWGNRGRRDDVEPFWGNRGRRDKMEPFWGNRGRRDDVEPFWGTRGRRETKLPYWGSYGKDKAYWTGEETDPFWGIRSRRKTALKDNIINAMNMIEYDIENLSRMRRGNENSFWINRGRESKLKNLFNGLARTRYNPSVETSFRTPEQNTVYDDRIYAEEPYYILIERSSRSSAEDDPFFISRGKKYTNFKLPKNVRDRRGAIEDLVNSVRNDPYYIARGKKDTGSIKIGNFTISKNELVKAKELVCSAIDLLFIKNGDRKVKRDVDESERRTILKKLAAQLQIDPYFVSRGKKNGDEDVNEERLENFVNHIADMCD